MQAKMPFWFLRHCTQVVPLLPQWSNAVIIGDATSSPRSVDFGIPKGQFWDLFCLACTWHLSRILYLHTIDSMFYADDSQLYIAINPNDYSPALDTLRNCIDDVINWNTLNMLLCNPGKTEVLQFTSRFAQRPVLNYFSFGNTTIELSDKVCNLGVILDKELSLKQQVNDICQKAILAI